jgi:hypothetical protein
MCCRAGAYSLCLQVRMPNLNSAVSSTVSGAAEAIEAMEGQGWRLDSHSLHPGIRHSSMVMIFRRMPIQAGATP